MADLTLSAIDARSSHWGVAVCRLDDCDFIAFFDTREVGPLDVRDVSDTHDHDHAYLELKEIIHSTVTDVLDAVMLRMQQEMTRGHWELNRQTKKRKRGKQVGYLLGLQVANRYLQEARFAISEDPET